MDPEAFLSKTWRAPMAGAAQNWRGRSFTFFSHPRLQSRETTFHRCSYDVHRGTVYFWWGLFFQYDFTSYSMFILCTGQDPFQEGSGEIGLYCKSFQALWHLVEKGHPGFEKSAQDLNLIIYTWFQIPL